MMENRSENVHVVVVGASTEAAVEILTPGALRFVGHLCARFEPRRQALLQARKTRAIELDAGEVPTFLNSKNNDETDGNWKCAPVPSDLQDRRVEITGPVDRKMVINGLNSGANVYMADLEDSTSPTWTNVTAGQVNLRDAVQRTISYTHPSTGKVYALSQKTATLFVRPRGWHLDEAHVLVNGQVASASIFDFALYLFHNHAALTQSGTRPYYYLAKLESHHEAALWNDVFVAAQQYLGLASGTIRATILLETITAAFEMEEILYAIRDHSVGLNCGRWDYLFSYIKKFKHHHDKLTPDRHLLTMTTPLMQAYVKRLIHICHKRGTFAMGGMSACIPIKHDEAANQRALLQVQEDKLREVQAGHDGTWVAHPALVAVAKQVFDDHMPTPNQIHPPATAAPDVTEADLLELPRVECGITSRDLSHGIAIVLAYTEAWLRGIGCIPLNHAMEDAATAEISRAQIWQWRAQGASTLDDGQLITGPRISQLVQEQVQDWLKQEKNANRWKLAGRLVEEMLRKDELDDFLTSVCYPYIVKTVTEGTPARL